LTCSPVQRSLRATRRRGARPREPPGVPRRRVRTTQMAGQQAATVEFQRLERVRSEQRSRRKRRLVVAVTFGIALAAVSLSGFLAVRKTPSEGNGSDRRPSPVGMPALEAAPTPPAAVPFRPTPSASPQRARPDNVRADTPLPRPVPAPLPPPDEITLPAPRSSSRAVVRDLPPPSSAREDSRSDGHVSGATEPSSSEARDSEIADPAAVINWLLKNSRSRRD
jgi:hypothetical protein